MPPPKPDKDEKKVQTSPPKNWQAMSSKEKDALLYELARNAGLVR